MRVSDRDPAARVVVVGSGLAGLLVALRLAPRPVVLATRAGLGAESSSAFAQGGLAASLGPDDGVDRHRADTVAAGDGLCDPQAVTAILADAPAAVATLESLGVRFDRTADGAYAFGLEAAHGRRRILHVAGDGTGAAIVRALAERVRATPSIDVLEGVDVRRLLVAEGRVCGLVCADRGGGFVLPAACAVLATGGLGGLYEATTNPAGAFGQGVMMAARAGATLADMEFVQFHPTALDTAGRPLGLVSEAVRGEGAVLVNERGERFLAAVPGAELAPRDVVARAIAAEIARGGRVFVDARAALGPRFGARFPAIEALCRAAGFDPARDLLPVRPAAHYHMGGVATDLAGRASLSGLWVIGEAAATGLHGANRLASNSLLEAAVMAMRAAADVAGAATAEPARPATPIALPAAASAASVRAVVSRDLGVLREVEGLERAIAALLPLAEGGGPSSDPAVVALAVAVFGWLRPESRGAHARTDHPLPLTVPERRRMTLDAVLDAARAIAAGPLARSA